MPTIPVSVISPWSYPFTITPPTINAWYIAESTMTSTPLFQPGVLYYHALTNNAVTTTGIITAGTTMGAPTSTIQPWYQHGATQAPSLARPALLEADAEAIFERSVRLFRRFRPESDVTNFNAGKFLTIRGHRFDYRVKRSEDPRRQVFLMDSAHIPYVLDLMTKDGKKVANGCVTLRDTPIFDQLLALMFHVKDPDEEPKLIAKTNWTPRLRPEVLALAA